MTEPTKSDEDIPDLSLQDITDGSNERDIPMVKFIDDVGDFAQSFTPPASAELLIGAFTQLYQKYKSVESSLEIRKNRLEDKVPELRKSLTMVRTLAEKDQAPVRYNLADNLFASADLDLQAGTVHLWLGANVMLEFPFDEAIQFLEAKLSQAETDLATTEADLLFVRDQTVTSEVNMSRIFNWDVRRKRSASSTNQ